MSAANLGPFINPVTGNERVIVDTNVSGPLAQPGADSNYTNTGAIAELALAMGQAVPPILMPAPAAVAPPNTPGNIWFSNSLWRCGIDPGPSNRFPITTGAEPSVWFYNNTWYLMTASSNQQLCQCAGNLDPTIAANWVNQVGTPGASTSVIGGGHAGYTQSGSYANPAHSWVMVDPTDGHTLWCWFENTNGAGGKGTILVAKSDVDHPYNWTWESSVVCVTGPTTGANTVNGNVSMAYDTADGLWHMFLEVIYLTPSVPSPISGGGPGSTYYDQIAHLTSPTPDGVFTLVHPYLTSISTATKPAVSGSHFPYAPQQYGNHSGPWIGYDAGTALWVLYYHGSTWGRSNFPSSIFRATNPTLATDTWTLCDQGYACLTRSTVIEVDQTQDMFISYGPLGGGPSSQNPPNPGAIAYAFFTAGDNRNSSVTTFITPLMPALHICDGAGFWRKVTSGQDPNPPAYSNLPSVFWNIEYNAALFPQGSGGSGTPANVGTWVLDYSNTYPFGARSLNTSAALNDIIWFDAVMTAPGTWEVVMNCQTGPAQGIVTFYLGDGGPNSGIGVPIGTMDTYSASDTFGVQFTIPSITLGGYDTIRRRVGFKVTAKNASSSGYGFGWHGFTLVRTDL